MSTETDVNFSHTVLKFIKYVACNLYFRAADTGVTVRNYPIQMPLAFFQLWCEVNSVRNQLEQKLLYTCFRDDEDLEVDEVDEYVDLGTQCLTVKVSFILH